MPADSRVEIDAKITAGVCSRSAYFWYSSLIIIAGYFTTGHRMTTEELEAVHGRTWEEWVFALTY
jgi:uncharacterized membrane protein